jgi:ATP phosphoribosyltransferase regulatory subunit
VELIGEAGVDADVEVIALAAEALLTAGLDRPAISVGHAGFLRGILSTLSEASAEAARDLLYRKAFAELESVIAPGPVLEALRLLPSLRGPDALDRAQPLAMTADSRAALDVLRVVLDGVGAHAQPVGVEVNLGLIRDFEYYSGIVFEAHAPRGGMPLLGGGRYDDLLARFGHPAPATGFAIGLEERVLTAVADKARLRPAVVARYTPGQYRGAVQIAVQLRRVGLAAVVASVDSPPGSGPAVCAVTVTPNGFVVESDGRTQLATAEEVLDAVRSAMGAGEWTP